MNTFKMRTLFFFGMIALAVFVLATHYTTFADVNYDVTDENIDIARAYIETHDISLLAANIEIHIAGYEDSLVGMDAVKDFHAYMYGGRGIILGTRATDISIISISENAVYVEYTYSGTAFSGDYVPVETMLDSTEISVQLVSILEILDGVIVKEFVFASLAPESVALNQQAFLGN